MLNAHITSHHITERGLYDPKGISPPKASGCDGAECNLAYRCGARFLEQNVALEAAIGSHACSLEALEALEANKRVTNSMPLGLPLPLSYRLAL
jgi:hypothetical protein